MVTVILLALSTSVGSVISVIPISDDTLAACPTITNNATFISAILASATTCYRKDSEGAGEEGERRKGEGRCRRGKGEGGGSRGRRRGGAVVEGRGEGQESKGEEGEGRGHTVSYHNLT